MQYICQAVYCRMSMAWFILGLVLYYLVLLSERVLMGISPHALEQLSSSVLGSAIRAKQLVSKPRRTLAALLLARLLLKILIAVCATASLVRNSTVHAWITTFSEDLGLQPSISWALSTVLWIVVLALFFWGLKQFSWPELNSNRARIGLQRLSRFVHFWTVLFRPFLPVDPDAESEPSILPEGSNSAGAAQATFEKQRDIELLKSIVKFSDVTVKQVMQPRSKVVAVDFRTNFGDLLQIVRESGFSRMPVYDEDLDNVTGILYVKDLLLHLSEPEDFEWQPIIRTNFQLVPESKRVSELLQEFKSKRRHMAIVVDEYGGSSGIITMEDILEEVTGEIRDEFDEESEIRYRKLDDHNYLFEGQTLLNDVCRIAGLSAGAFDAARGAADTLAGLALELKGDIPNPGTELHWENFLLTVISADNRKIEQIKLTIG